MTKAIRPLLAPQGGGELLLAGLLEGGFFGDGDGQGIGDAGLRPVPRELHGVIMISTGVASLPEAAGILKGSPVCTVYLGAPGFRRKWIFQVCARDGSAAEGIKNCVLKVVSRGSLDLPYALTKAPVRFEELGEDPLPRRTVIRAIFVEEGAVDDLKVVAGADPRTDDVLMASLRERVFNPAFCGGRPVAVEALFGIPLRYPPDARTAVSGRGRACDMLTEGLAAPADAV